MSCAHSRGSLLFLCLFSATIGPPKVNSVIVSSDSLLISVTPPFGSEAGDFLRYHVSYWENATSTTKKVCILIYFVHNAFVTKRNESVSLGKNAEMEEEN